MDIQEITTYLEQNKDSEGVKNFVASFYTPDKLNPVLDSETGLKLIQPRIDKHVSKGIETFKTNSLPKLIDDEVNKRFPGESEDAKRIKKIELDLEGQRLAATREKIKNIAITKLTEAKMPVGLANILVADTEDAFNSNFNSIKSIWDKELNERIKVELKKNGRTPHKEGSDKHTDTSEMNSLIRGAAGIGVSV